MARSKAAILARIVGSGGLGGLGCLGREGTAVAPGAFDRCLGVIG